MLDKIDDTIRLLIQEDVPSNVLMKMRDIRNDLRCHPCTDHTYDVIRVLRKYSDKWADKALQLWIGKRAAYAHSRDY